MKKRVRVLLAALTLTLGACSSAAGPGATGSEGPIPMEPMPGSPAAQAEQGKLPTGGAAPR